MNDYEKGYILNQRIEKSIQKLKELNESGYIFERIFILIFGVLIGSFLTLFIIRLLGLL